METKWLEDFLSVAETGNFTRSAQARHLTQPALTRRIRALENWLGVQLIDRGSYPTRLTSAGKAFRQHALEIMEKIDSARSQLRLQSPLAGSSLTIALPHTLSLTFFPRWFTGVRRHLGDIGCRLVAGNVHDALALFTEGNSDLLICYHHPRHPIALDPRRYACVSLGQDRLRPYSACGERGAARFPLPGRPDARLPYLAYTPDAYLRRISDLLLDQAPEKFHLRQTYESAMAEGLKQMVLQGHGVAFLPESTVADDLARGSLAIAGGAAWSVDMEILLYKELRRDSEALRSLWEFLRPGGQS